MSSGIAQKEQQKSMPQSLVAVFMLLMVLLRESAGNIIYIYTYMCWVILKQVQDHIIYINNIYTGTAKTAKKHGGVTYF